MFIATCCSAHSAISNCSQAYRSAVTVGPASSSVKSATRASASWSWRADVKACASSIASGPSPLGVFAAPTAAAKSARATITLVPIVTAAVAARYTATSATPLGIRQRRSIHPVAPRSAGVAAGAWIEVNAGDAAWADWSSGPMPPATSRHASTEPRTRYPQNPIARETSRQCRSTTANLGRRPTDQHSRGTRNHTRKRPPGQTRACATIWRRDVTDSNTSESASFGELLRTYRQAAGLTQQALAEQAGLSWRGIQDLERGARSIPHATTITRLAEALRLD